MQIAQSLEKDLKKPPKKEKARLFEQIEQLAENPRPKDCKKLQASQKPPLYRIR